MSIFFIGWATGLTTPLSGQEEPLTEQGYEREELGVNPYTAPSIARIFQQLDNLRPLPFEQLQREFPKVSPPGREQKGLIFGGLIADGFLVVEAERKNAVDNLGRLLTREARGLGVADRVMRHSASLTELGRRGTWQAVRKELIATQADVKQAMIELREQKNGAFDQPRRLAARTGDQRRSNRLDFSAQRAKILAQEDLVDYFTGELKTLPPMVTHTPLFEKISGGGKRHSRFFKQSKSGWLETSRREIDS